MQLDTYKLKYFLFKHKVQDFIVEEKLDYTPEGKGHVFYVMFEKKFLNTFDIIDFLSKQLNLQRKHFWIWWLKDKFWITRQRISIYKRTLNSRGGVKKFLDILWKKAKILKISWWDRLLKVWENSWNLFFIRLRPLFWKDNFVKIKKILPYVIEEIKQNWVPNYFWIQRFWKKLSNPDIGKNLLLWKINIKNPVEAQFKVQALSSWLFNRYLDLRIKKQLFNKNLHWDILFNQERKVFSMNSSLNEFYPTGPVYWFNLVVWEKQPYFLEYENFKNHWFTWKDLEKFKKFDVYGIRRSIKFFPKDIRFKWKWKDLLIMFELPSGSYASIVVNYLDYLLNNFLKSSGIGASKL